MSSNTDHSLMTIPEGSTYYSLSFDFNDSCDKCKKFNQQKIELSSGKQGRNSIPLCEKPWFISLTECNYTRLSNKKQVAMEILYMKGFSTNDNNYEKQKRSKLYCLPPSRKRSMCQKPISSGFPQSTQSMYSANELVAVESISALSRAACFPLTPPTIPQNIPLTIP